MIIYIACTVRGDRMVVDSLCLLCDRLEADGHRILTKHLLDDHVDRAEGLLSEHDVYARDIDWLTSCDVLIAEASGSSYGVGFEVGYVLGRSDATSQRVLLLYRSDRRDVVSRLIVGASHPRCASHGYRDTDDLIAFVAKALA
jgi:hypothetical protein